MAFGHRRKPPFCRSWSQPEMGPSTADGGVHTSRKASPIISASMIAAMMAIRFRSATT